MRRSPLIATAGLASAFVLACGDRSGVTDPAPNVPAFAPAGTGTNVSVVDVDFTDFLLCTEEAVHWTGTARIVDHFTVNRGVEPSLIQHSVVIESVQLTGVGETTGDTYTFLGRFSEIIQSPDPVEPFPTTITVTIRDRIFGPDGGVLGIGLFSFKFVLNGTDELVIEDEEFTGQCL